MSVKPWHRGDQRVKRHLSTAFLLVLVGASLVMFAISNRIAPVRAESKPFETYLGYGRVMLVDDGMQADERYEGFADISGSSLFPDVVAIVAHDGFSPRSVQLASSDDGTFKGRVWFLDGPGTYKLSLATRSSPASSYTIMCSAIVQNISEDVPLVPCEYVGYGEDLVIHSPWGGSSRVSQPFTIEGWSRYSKVRAVIENLDTRQVMEYIATAAPDGSFRLRIPLEVGLGNCEVKICSKRIDASTWRGAAVYRIRSVAGSVHMTEPSYQEGLIAATGPFRVRGTSQMQGPIELLMLNSRGGRIAEPISAQVCNGEWSALVVPPEGENIFQLHISDVGLGAECDGRQYTVSIVPEQVWPERRIPENVRSVADKIARSVDPGGSHEYSIVKAVHDWVASNITYDARGANTGNTGPGDAGITLSRREGVCLGYANLTAALLQPLGLRCRVVIGNADNGKTIVRHAWNEVEVDGRLVFMDVTWDAGIVDGWNFTPRLQWTFFDPNPERVMTSHFPDSP